MPKKYKEILAREIEKHAPAFKLTNLFFNSFTLIADGNKEIAAAEMVHGVSALLENPTKQQDENSMDSDSFGISSQLVSNFWNAYAALDPKSYNLLMEGINMAKKIQSVVLGQACLMLKRNEIRKNGPNRCGCKSCSTLRDSFSVIRDNTDVSYFTHPLTLSRLCHLLSDIYAEHGKSTKPLVLFVFKNNLQCIVAGSPGQHSGSGYIPKYVFFHFHSSHPVFLAKPSREQLRRR